MSSTLLPALARPGLALLLALCGVLVVPSSGVRAQGGTAETRRPNMVLILADDMGYECVSANGGPKGVELARDRRFKLYRDGRLLDVLKDPLEIRPLDPAELIAEASAARAGLAAVLERMRGTRNTYDLFGYRRR